MRVEGNIPPMVTPVDPETGEINEDVLRSFTNFLVGADVDGLFPCGSTGEFPSLSRSQRKTVIETVVEAADGVPVLAGCGDPSVNRVATLIDDAAIAGADGAVVVTPYYLETTQDSLRDYYTRTADRAALPIVLYDIPSLTGHHLTTATVASLADHDNIIALKTSAGNAVGFFDLATTLPSSFKLLTGAPELTIQSYSVGGQGVIAGPANVFPGVVSRLTEHCQAGNYRLAIELMNDVMLPCLVAIRSMPTVPALKHLLTLRGYDVGPPLPPLPRLSDTQQRDLEARFGELSSIRRTKLDD